MATTGHTESRSRQKILEILKQRGELDAAALAEELNVSAMAVRQHLYALADEKLVTFGEQPRPMGRPAKLWRLTEAADRLFPDAHAALCIDLVAALGDTFGKKGMEKLVAARARRQLAEYQSKMPKRASLRKRLERLVEIRTEEGYMAELLEEENGSLLLVENHCPICDAASACVGLCAAELELFQELLGEKIEVERTEHILEGARRCAYRVGKRLAKK